jgi:hypothetical protein
MRTDRCSADHSPMSDRGFHRIEADLEASWLEDWVGVGIAEIEAYLAKHAAFLSFLDGETATSNS